MVVVQEGSYKNIVVRCVSERMNGKPFNANTLPGLHDYETHGGPASEWHPILAHCADSNPFLDYLCSENCQIAYDYIESRLVMINPDKDFNYILNIKDGAISKNMLPFKVNNVINNYPDYLLQATDAYDGKIYSFYEKPREETIDSRDLYSFLLTRPMKLSGPVSKASLRQLKNVGFWDEAYSRVETALWLSDDMKTWYQDESRFGAAAKYYRLAIFIKMLPSERLSGTIITSQDRRTNNFR